VLAPLSRAQARRLVTAMTQPHPCRIALMARRDADDGSPRRACPEAADDWWSSGTEIARDIIRGGLGWLLAAWRDVSCTSTLPAATARMVSRRAQSP
jgi:hypothetical protein